MSYYMHMILARVPAGPTRPDPRRQTLTRAAPIIISCKAKQLGASALLSLPSPFFIVLGKKRLIKLRKYPFPPPPLQV